MLTWSCLTGAVTLERPDVPQGGLCLVCWLKRMESRSWVHREGSCYLPCALVEYLLWRTLGLIWDGCLIPEGHTQISGEEAFRGENGGSVIWTLNRVNATDFSATKVRRNSIQREERVSHTWRPCPWEYALFPLSEQWALSPDLAKLWRLILKWGHGWMCLARRCRSMMAYYLLQHSKLPQNLVAETINIYDLVPPVGQEAKKGLAGCFWLKSLMRCSQGLQLTRARVISKLCSAKGFYPKPTVMAVCWVQFLALTCSVPYHITWVSP